MSTILNELKAALESIRAKIAEGKSLTREEQQTLFLTAIANEAQNGES